MLLARVEEAQAEADGEPTRLGFGGWRETQARWPLISLSSEFDIIGQL
ncbi:MAG: hypothetical protein ACK2UC_01050 [Anaerolineae bacterium]